MKPIKYNGLTLTIEYDDYTNYNPREENNNLGKMLCWHRKYDIGDDNPYDSPVEFWENKELQEEIFALRKVYMLHHGGVIVSDAPFACDPNGRDSGIVGIVYAAKDEVVQRYGELNDEIKELVIQDLSQEIADYNDYLNPNYRSYVIEGLDGEILESCGGFGYDEELELLQDMKRSSQYAGLFDKAIDELTASEM
jgi:hypothetical protein